MSAVRLSRGARRVRRRCRRRRRGRDSSDGSVVAVALEAALSVLRACPCRSIRTACIDFVPVEEVSIASICRCFDSNSSRRRRSSAVSCGRGPWRSSCSLSSLTSRSRRVADLNASRSRSLLFRRPPVWERRRVCRSVRRSSAAAAATPMADGSSSPPAEGSGGVSLARSAARSAVHAAARRCRGGGHAPRASDDRRLRLDAEQQQQLRCEGAPRRRAGRRRRGEPRRAELVVEKKER